RAFLLRQLTQPGLDQRGVLLGRQQLAEVVLGAYLADDLCERQVRRSLAVRDAAPDEDPRVAVELGGQLLRQARLPDSRLPEEQEEAATVLVDGASERL